jgi:hypothetical protein
MGTSAFDILFVPIFLTTLGSCVVGAAILGLIRALEMLVNRAVRAARSFRESPSSTSDRTASRGLRLRGPGRPG